MGADEAAPCRHAGAPPPEVLDRVSRLIRTLGREEALPHRHGISIDEFQDALPAAIETLRGSMSASTADRREFLGSLLDYLQASGAVQSVRKPDYGDDTVYRLSIAGQDDVAIIQKGCPDGAHIGVARTSTAANSPPIGGELVRLTTAPREHREPATGSSPRAVPSAQPARRILM